MSVGELFILGLGFFGKVIPGWLREFAARHGLGGVILFDYSCQTGKYDNNIDSPRQLRGLCAEISALPSGPMVFVEGRRAGAAAQGGQRFQAASQRQGIQSACAGNETEIACGEPQ
jgi:hypothetical protein